VRDRVVPESLSKFEALSSVVNFGLALPIGSKLRILTQNQKQITNSSQSDLNAGSGNP
jgi:hypothetical protein